MREDFVVAQGTDGAEHLRFFIANSVGIERDGRFHRHQGQHLEDVAGHHVAQRPGMIVIGRAMLHPHGFRHGDLHVVHVAAVPDRLENPIGEPEYHQVLHRFLAQVMIDAEHLRFVQATGKRGIEFAGRRQIMSKRLFDDHAPPVLGLALVGCLGRKAGGSQLLGDRAEEARRRRQVKQVISAGPAAGIHIGQQLLKLLIRLRILEFTLLVEQSALGKFVPAFRIEARASHLPNALRHVLLEAVAIQFVKGKADHRKLIGQQFAVGQVAQGRQQFSLCQIACGSKNHHRTGARRRRRIGKRRGVGAHIGGLPARNTQRGDWR